jgi:hypothetical protein
MATTRRALLTVAESGAVVGSVEEVDVKAGSTVSFDPVGYFWRDRLRRVGSDDHVDWRIAIRDEADLTRLDAEHAPHPGCDPMVTPQAARHGLSAPCGCAPLHLQSLGQLGPIAERAFKQCPDPGRPFCAVEDPWSDDEGRLVTDVPDVQT